MREDYKLGPRSRSRLRSVRARLSVLANQVLHEAHVKGRTRGQMVPFFVPQEDETIQRVFIVGW